MSAPLGGAGVSPGDWWLYQSAVAPVSTMATERTQANMSNYYKNAVKDSPGYNNAWSAVDASGINPSLVGGIDASKITSGTIGDGLVPSIGALRDAIYQGYNGGTTTGHTAAQVKAILAAIASGLPVSGAVIDAIYQGYYGGSSTGHTASQVKTIVDDIASRLSDLESRVTALEAP